MTHWNTIAASLDPPVPAEDAERAAAVLAALEIAFRPLTESIPAESDMWGGPE